MKAQLSRLDQCAAYDEAGRSQRAEIDSLLPADWTWEGKTLLDFRCGAGRMLRQFVGEAASTQIIGFDTHAPSITWLNSNATMFTANRCGDTPWLPGQPDSSVDVVTAFSAFTRLTTYSLAWLLELHRVLRPGGVLIAGIFNAAAWHHAYAGTSAFDSDRVGMRIVNDFTGWDVDTPKVFIAEWWLREHWGRAFDVLEVVPRDAGPSDGLDSGKSLVVLRRREVELTSSDLEAVLATEPREAPALVETVAQLNRDVDAAREKLALYADRLLKALRMCQAMETQMNQTSATTR